MERFEGRTAIVGGGARGLGASHVRALVAEGARVVVGDVLDEDGAALVADLGERARYAHLDVTDEQQWVGAVELARTDFGSVDVLVNNAGINRPGGVETQSAADFRMQLEVKLTGAFLGMRAVLPVMRDQDRGSVVNVSSTAGLVGCAGLAGYTASKWGVRGLTEAAALDLAGTRVRVDSVHPGPTRSAMTADLGDGATAGQVMRRLGEPEEITRLVLFLASEESSFSTGAEFVADGGAVLGHVPQL